MLLLHIYMPFIGLITREGGTVRRRFDAFPCGEKGNISAGRLVRRGSRCESQVGLFNDVLLGDNLLRVTTRSDVNRWVGRHASNVFSKPDRMVRANA
jgi:hypothetical protein